MPDARPRGGRRRPETFGRARRRAQRMLIQESGPPVYIASVSGASGSDGSARQYWERTTALYRPTSSPPGVSRFRRRVRKVRQTPLADRCRSVDTENPMASADAFWSRAQDHEPHGCRATWRDAHRLLRHTLDLALAREILHADNVIARCNLRAVKMPTPPLTAPCRSFAPLPRSRAHQPKATGDMPGATRVDVTPRRQWTPRVR